MRNSGTEKTKSAPKPAWQKAVIAASLVLAVLVLAVLISIRTALAPPAELRLVEVRLGAATFRLEVAEDASSRAAGLSGRSRLRPDEGMLFSFGQPGRHCFWMKDMDFPLDLIWLDAEGEIIDIKPEVSPDTYPDMFCPDEPALYVIEIASGKAAELGLKTGDRVDI